MSSVNSKIAKNFIDLSSRYGGSGYSSRWGGYYFLKGLATVILLASISAPAFAWEVDFSRRQTEFNKIQNADRLPASVSEEKPMTFVTQIFEGSEPTQDVVIMNTEKGFIPETIRLKKNGNYRFHIVNVNQKEKNVSFILDAFAEHHNTIFGEEKSFSVSPKTDGVFSYQCPETSVQGKIIIFSEGERKPASAE